MFCIKSGLKCPEGAGCMYAFYMPEAQELFDYLGGFLSMNEPSHALILKSAGAITNCNPPKPKRKHKAGEFYRNI